MEQHIYLNFRKKGQCPNVREFRPGNFRSIWFSPVNFCNFRSHWMVRFSETQQILDFFSSVPDSKFLNECIDKSSQATSIEIELLIHFRSNFTCWLLRSKEMKFGNKQGGSRYSFVGRGTLSKPHCPLKLRAVRNHLYLNHFLLALWEQKNREKVEREIQW